MLVGFNMCTAVYNTKNVPKTDAEEFVLAEISQRFPAG
jgi:hypothetical protein